MQIASPIYLIALVPWAGLVFWLLLGKRRRVDVSFLELWKGPVTGPTAKRRVGMPPIALAAILAAMLLGILAAARPGIVGTARGNEKPIVMVVDRGVTMSAGRPARFAALADEVKGMIRDQFGERELDVVFVPGGDVVKRKGTEWVNAVKGAAGTAVDTRGMIEGAVREQLELNPGAAVVVLSDQEPRVDDKRVVRVGPAGSLKNISIAHVAARISPVGQVQVRVRNRSEEGKVVIRVVGDGRESARQEVELPGMGQTRDYFLPIEKTARVIRIELEAADDFAGDNMGFLARRGSWPVIEARTQVFAELARLIEKYSKLRPAGGESKRVGIVAAGADGEIILGKIGTGGSGKVTVVDHPITKALEKVDWGAMAGEGVADAPGGPGWDVLVRVGERAVLAARNAPARRVWVGVSTQRMASSAEFVMLWSNIFDWVGEGGEEFTAEKTGQLGSGWKAVEEQAAGLSPGWWPGIYRRADGVIMAVNAPDVVLPEARAGDWRARLGELARRHREASGVRWLTTPLILGSMGLMLVAAMMWRGGLRKQKTLRRTIKAEDMGEAPMPRSVR
ncbi:MAG TPA: hypothetical protein VGQ99_22415 [Tepidisphaeraceae bacterium]|nr:hypothetical protein [Tepidisphaeraceae bacterium]